MVKYIHNITKTGFEDSSNYQIHELELMFSCFLIKRKYSNHLAIPLRNKLVELGIALILDVRTICLSIINS